MVYGIIGHDSDHERDCVYPILEYFGLIDVVGDIKIYVDKNLDLYNPKYYLNIFRDNRSGIISEIKEFYDEYELNKPIKTVEIGDIDNYKTIRDLTYNYEICQDSWCNIYNCIELFHERPGEGFCYIPKHLLTQEMCELAVEINVGNIEAVPDKFKTKEMCDMALDVNSQFLEHIPEKFITMEIAERCVDGLGYNILYVPQQLITHELCKTAVTDKGQSLQHIPDEFKTAELCRLAVKNDFAAMDYVPERFKTPELQKKYEKKKFSHMFK